MFPAHAPSLNNSQGLSTLLTEVVHKRLVRERDVQAGIRCIAQEQREYLCDWLSGPASLRPINYNPVTHEKLHPLFIAVLFMSTQSPIAVERVDTHRLYTLKYRYVWVIMMP